PLAFLNARLPDTDEDDLLEAEGLISAAETTLAEQSANADDPLTAKLIATRAEEAKSMMAALAGEKAIRETSLPSSSDFETGSSTRRHNPHPEEGQQEAGRGEAPTGTRQSPVSKGGDAGSSGAGSPSQAAAKPQDDPVKADPPQSDPPADFDAERNEAPAQADLEAVKADAPLLTQAQQERLRGEALSKAEASSQSFQEERQRLLNQPIPDTQALVALEKQHDEGLDALLQDLQAQGVAPPEPEFRRLEGADALGGLILDLLPGIGELRSAEDAVESFEATAKSLEEGDMLGAAFNGAMTLLDGLGTVPVAGKAAKIAGLGVKGLASSFLGIAARQATRNPERHAKEFSDWAGEIIETGRASSKARVVPAGRLSPEVKGFLEEKGIEITSDAIVAFDKRILRMVRDSKTAGGRALPQEMIQKMPEALANPKAVLFDKADNISRGRNRLLYVVEIPGEDGKAAKFVVDIEFPTTTREGRSVQPTVISAGRVQSESLINDGSFDVIAGSLLE
ncbi:hypothetical protein, partial [Limibacillus sp. MBR-115]|uniref:hypothetical protein n=1 Tax=Limibacillus sp. MBR-115 TaxID=3156465 RepID=UPI003392B402